MRANQLHDPCDPVKATIHEVTMNPQVNGDDDII